MDAFSIVIPSVISSMLGRLDVSVLFLVGLLFLGWMAFKEYVWKKVS